MSFKIKYSHCFICLNKCEDAIMLDCLHICCRSCAIQVSNKTNNQIKCLVEMNENYQCNQVTMITPDEINKLSKWIPPISNERSSSSVVYCENCEENQPAVGKCVDCNEYLCDLHLKGHKASKKTKNHQIEEIEVSTSLLMFLSSKCSFHPQQELDYYCQSCNQLICSECGLMNHKNNHQVKKSKEMIEEYHKKLQERLNEEIPSKKIQIEEIQRKMEQKMEDSTTQSNSIRNEINEFFDELIEGIEKHRREMMKKVEDFDKLNQKRIDIDLDCLDRLKWKLKDLSEIGASYMNEMKKNSVGLMSMIDLMNKQIDRLMNESIEEKLLSNSKEEIVIKNPKISMKELHQLITEKSIDIQLIKPNHIDPTKCLLLPIERIDGIEGNNQEEMIELIQNQRYSMKMKLVDDSDQPIPFNPNQQQQEQEERKKMKVRMIMKKEKEEESEEICEMKDYQMEEIQENNKRLMKLKWICSEIGWLHVRVWMNSIEIKGSPMKIEVKMNKRNYKSINPQHCRSVGREGKGKCQFNFPIGVVIDQQAGHYFVSEWNNHRIQVMRVEDHSHLYFIGDPSCQSSDSVGKFKCPWGLTINDQSASLFVCDNDNKRIQVIASIDGSYRHHFSTGDRYKPRNIVMNQNDQLLVSLSSDQIGVYSTEGKLIKMIGSKGSGDGQLNNPVGLGLDSRGNLIVGDSNNNRISIFDGNGCFVLHFGQFSEYLFEFNNLHLVVDSFDRIIVSDLFGHNLKFFESDYSLISKFGSNGRNIGQFDGPQGMDIDQDGNLFVCDTGNHRLQIISSPY